MPERRLLDDILYPPNVDLGADTLVQVAVIAGALAETAELLGAARPLVDVDRLAADVERARGRFALSPEEARTFVHGDDDRVREIALRALVEAVGDEAELSAEDVDADAGSLILVVGVLLQLE